MKLLICIVFFSGVFSPCYSQNLVYVVDNRAYFQSDNAESETKSSGWKILPYSGETHYTINRSTLGIAGSSKTFETYNGTYYVSHSIGQRSVIGTYKNDQYTLAQGYQQLILPIKRIWPEPNNLKAIVYPNPFDQSLNIKIREPVTNELIVVIISIEGKTVFTKKYPAAQRINIQPGGISKGIYIIKVTAGDKLFKAKLLKE